MQKEKLGITGLYIHCICSTATTTQPTCPYMSHMGPTWAGTWGPYG